MKKLSLQPSDSFKRVYFAVFVVAQIATMFIATSLMVQSAFAHQWIYAVTELVLLVYLYSELHDDVRLVRAYFKVKRAARDRN